MKRFALILLILAIAVGAYACGKNAPPPPEGKTVATVNNIPITDTMVINMIQGIRDPRQLMNFYSLEGKKMLIDKIIDIELVAAAARREGMENDAEVRRILDHYTKQVLFVAYLQKKLGDMANSLDETAAQTYYNEHPEEFKRGERIKVSHILLAAAEDAPEADVQAAEKKAQALLKKIQGGADFAQVAGESSDDGPTKSKGGSLGIVTRGQMESTFDEAAFGLAEPGLVDKPIRTKKGFHLIKVEEKLPADQVPFEEIKARLVQKLRVQSQQDAYDRVIGELRTAASINVDDTAVEAIQIPMPQGMPGMPGMSGMSGMSGMQQAVPATP